MHEVDRVLEPGAHPAGGRRASRRAHREHSAQQIGICSVAVVGRESLRRLACTQQKPMFTTLPGSLEEIATPNGAQLPDAVTLPKAVSSTSPPSPQKLGRLCAGAPPSMPQACVHSCVPTSPHRFRTRSPSRASSALLRAAWRLRPRMLGVPPPVHTRAATRE